jgi:hypothetical protein
MGYTSYNIAATRITRTLVERELMGALGHQRCWQVEVKPLNAADRSYQCYTKLLTQDRKTVAVVILVEVRRVAVGLWEFCYKTMSENEGPHYFHPSLALLKSLPATDNIRAQSWRSVSMANHYTGGKPIAEERHTDYDGQRTRAASLRAMLEPQMSAEERAEWAAEARIS